MADITDLSDLINLATGGGAVPAETTFFHKVARSAGAAATAPIAGRPCSLWRYDGQPGAGAVPGAAAVPTNATTGCIPFTSPTGGREAHLTQAWATGLNGGTLILYDRLLHNGGLSGTTTTAQTVGGTLTRNTGGAGNMLMVEIYTIIGTTATTITASYTNEAGTSSRTTTAVVFGGTGFREVTRATLLPLQSGDTGVRACATTTVLATTGTAGSFGVSIIKPLAYIGVGGPGAPGWRDFITGMPGIPTIEAGACLSLLWVPVTAAAPELMGGIHIVEK